MVKGVVPSPPRYVSSFLSRTGFSAPTARPFSSNDANSRSRACANHFFYANPYEYVHSVGIEPTKLILVNGGQHLFFLYECTSAGWRFFFAFSYRCGSGVVRDTLAISEGVSIPLKGRRQIQPTRIRS